MNDKLLKKLILETLQETLLNEEAPGAPDSSGAALKDLQAAIFANANIKAQINSMLQMIKKLPQYNTELLDEQSKMQAVQSTVPQMVSAEIPKVHPPAKLGMFRPSTGQSIPYQPGSQGGNPARR